jgi:hypothetical protein
MPRIGAFLFALVVGVGACVEPDPNYVPEFEVNLTVHLDTAQGFPLPIVDGQCQGTLWTSVKLQDGTLVEADTVAFNELPIPPQNGGDCWLHHSTDEKVGPGDYRVEFSVGLGLGATTPVWNSSCVVTTVAKKPNYLVATYGSNGCVLLGT